MDVERPGGAKDRDFDAFGPVCAGADVEELGEGPLIILLKEHRKLQDMVRRLHHTQTAHMDRCHQELKVLVGRRSFQDMFSFPREESASVADSCNSRTGRPSDCSRDDVDEVGEQARLQLRGLAGEATPFESRSRTATGLSISATSHMNSEDIKRDKRTRSLLTNYYDLKNKSNRVLSKRFLRSLGRTRHFFYAFFAKQYLQLDALKAFVAGAPFITFFATLILLNAMAIGFTTNNELREAFDKIRGRHADVNTQAEILRVIDIVFTAMFCLELALKMAALEFRFFFATDWKWNVLDLVLVMISVVETILTNSSLQLSHIRVLRLFRVFRTLRVVREVPFFERLRMMINAVANSVASLVWALVLLFSTIYMFSCVLLQGATQYISNGHDSEDPNISFLSSFFPDLLRTMITLFMTTTGGISWWEVEVVLWEVGWVYSALFVLYIAVMILALLNIVTGIFLNDALEMAAMDRELQMKNELEKKAQIAEELRAVFSSLDSDNSGSVSLDEFEKFMASPDTKALFAVFGLDVADTVLFFDALDVDEDRQLKIEEFVMGCLQLRGHAKGVDLVTHMRENKKVMQRITSSARNTEAQLRDLRKMMTLACTDLSKTKSHLEKAREGPDCFMMQLPAAVDLGLCLP